jgi:hypothetical protein
MKIVLSVGTKIMSELKIVKSVVPDSITMKQLNNCVKIAQGVGNLKRQAVTPVLNVMLEGMPQVTVTESAIVAFQVVLQLKVKSDVECAQQVHFINPRQTKLVFVRVVLLDGHKARMDPSAVKVVMLDITQKMQEHTIVIAAVLGNILTEVLSLAALVLLVNTQPNMRRRSVPLAVLEKLLLQISNHVKIVLRGNILMLVILVVKVVLEANIQEMLVNLTVKIAQKVGHPIMLSR